MNEPESKPVIAFTPRPAPHPLRTRVEGTTFAASARSESGGRASRGVAPSDSRACARAHMTLPTLATFAGQRILAVAATIQTRAKSTPVSAAPRSRFHAHPIAATLFHSAGGEAEMCVLDRAAIAAMLVAHAKAALAPFAGISL